MKKKLLGHQKWTYFAVFFNMTYIMNHMRVTYSELLLIRTPIFRMFQKFVRLSLDYNANHFFLVNPKFKKENFP